MASIIQRILGLGFLMSSIIFGMTLARSQVDTKAAPPSGSGSPQIPPNAMEAARAMYEEQMRANSMIQKAQKDPNASPFSTAPVPLPTATPSQAFVPSEVEIFQASLAKHVDPRAIIHTTLGDVEIKLFSALAPVTVKNFMDLAHGDREFSDARTSKKVRRPFYNGLTIHKVVSGEYLQMGCPMGNGHGGPGYTIPDEIVPQLKFDKPYVVAMASAREGVKVTKDSNGSQFFITLRPQEKWDGRYTIFGEVVKGQKILSTISSVDTGPTDRPIRKVFITAIDVINDEHPNAPAAVPEMHSVSQPGPASVMPPVPAAAPVAPAVGAPVTTPVVAPPAAAPVAPPANAPNAASPATSGQLAVPPQ